MTSRPSRRSLLGAGGALALSGAAGAGIGLGIRSGQAAPADPGAPLRIAYLPITDAAPLLIAHSRGLFAERGVEVAPPVRLRSWASMGETLLSGAVDLVHLLFPMALQMKIDLGADITVLGANHVDGSAITVGRGIQDIASLAGGVVAIPGWYSIHNVITQQVLRAEGLTPVIRRTPSRRRGEVTLVPMAPSDMIPALDAGSIAAFSVADPFNAMAEAKGIGRIQRFLGDVWRDHPCCVTVATGAFMRRPAEQIRAVTDSLVLAQQICREDRDAVAAELSGTYLPQPIAAITAALTRQSSGTAHVEHPDWHGESIDFSPVLRPGFTRTLVEELRASVLDAPLGALDRIDPAEAHDLVVDDSALRSSARDLDPSALTGLEDPEEIAP